MSFAAGLGAFGFWISIGAVVVSGIWYDAASPGSEGCFAALAGTRTWLTTWRKGSSSKPGPGSASGNTPCDFQAD